jgi:hypothetical protein
MVPFLRLETSIKQISRRSCSNSMIGCSELQCISRKLPSQRATRRCGAILLESSQVKGKTGCSRFISFGDDAIIRETLRNVAPLQCMR